MNQPIVKSAKIINVVSAALMMLAGVLLIFLPALEQAQRILLAILFGLTGAAKIFGYYSNDLYRLAFQFDLSTGIFCELLTLLILFSPSHAVSLLPTLLTVFVVIDALLKLQIALDARRFGMHGWLAILLTAVLVCIVGGASLYFFWRGFLTPMCAVGIALAVDGAENIWITAYTVRVRAKKKNLSRHYGMEEE